MTYPDASGVPANLLPRKDASAFEHLKQLVDSEPASLADPDWIGLLAAMGIEKGTPFKPDAKTRRILDAAAATAYQMSRVLGTKSAINGVDYKVYPDRQWINPMASGNPFDMAWHRPLDGSLALDARTNFFTNYYSWSPGMVSQVPGRGANYMVANFDGRACRSPAARTTRSTCRRTFRRRTSGLSRSTTPSTPPASTTASPSPRSVRATSPSPTPMVQSTSTSARRRPPGRRRTGWQPFQAAATSPSSGSIALPKQPSTVVGSRAISPR